MAEIDKALPNVEQTIKTPSDKEIEVAAEQNIQEQAKANQQSQEAVAQAEIQKNQAKTQAESQLEETKNNQWTASSLSEFYKFLARRDNIDEVPTLLSIASLSLTIYGIS